MVFGFCISIALLFYCVHVLGFRFCWWVFRALGFRVLLFIALGLYRFRVLGFVVLGLSDFIVLGRRPLLFEGFRVLLF